MYRVCLVGVLLSFLCGPAFADSTPGNVSGPSVSAGLKQEHRPSAAEQWPTTVEAAVDDVLTGLSERDKETLRQVKREDVARYQRGWGRTIRNDYGLWRGNEELPVSACGGRPCDPDAASLEIMRKVWDAVQEQ